MFFQVVMNLDGCVRLFSLQLFRTLQVGEIRGCFLVCVLSPFSSFFSIRQRAYSLLFWPTVVFAMHIIVSVYLPRVTEHQHYACTMFFRLVNENQTCETGALRPVR